MIDLASLTPTRVVASFDELTPALLRAEGIEAIITDLDNTLVPWRSVIVSPRLRDWLGELSVAGIHICIASNTHFPKRLDALAESLGIPYVAGVKKPDVEGLRRCMEVMGSSIANTAMFGDQLFTDILAGNRLGIRTILLRPGLSSHEFITTRLSRMVEQVVIWRQTRAGRWPAPSAFTVEQGGGGKRHDSMRL
ncbi:MAG: YqeG family HAD IIIA-type phosphatase [Capsulimonadaceae bacterium]